MKRSELYKLREMIEKAAALLPDDEATEAPVLFPAWAVGKAYAVGDRVTYKDKLYKVLQAHTSQADWTPDVAVSLYAEVLNPGPEIPEWVQPGSTNPYMKGDKVRHNGKVWESDYDNNVWEPGVFGWVEVSA